MILLYVIKYKLLKFYIKSVLYDTFYYFCKMRKSKILMFKLCYPTINDTSCWYFNLKLYVSLYTIYITEKAFLELKNELDNFKLELEEDLNMCILQNSLNEKI